MDRINSVIQISLGSTTIPVKVVFRSRKKITLKVNYNGALISAPPGTSKKELSKILEQHKDWLINQIKSFENKVLTHQTLKDNQILYKGEVWHFKIVTSVGKSIIINKEDLTISSGHLLRNDKLIKWYKNEAAFYLPPRLSMLAEKYGFQYNKVSVRTANSRWGSCTTAGNISLNNKLILAPEWVSDAIILHELTHTIHHNHSKKFWTHLKNLYPKWDDAIDWLKEYNIMIQNIWEK